MTIQDKQVLQRSADGQSKVTLDDGNTVTLPVGGPYTVGTAQDVYVGDLWVLAGQSNMEGVGDLTDVETPTASVRSYQSREQWAVAEEPLHWLGESPRFVHHQLWGRAEMPSQPDPRDPNRTKGSGLGLTFAKVRNGRNGVPVGLIPSAHGGTSMTQWDPKLRELGGDSLYGATYIRVQSNGGKVSGVLWYQGESDASPQDGAVYTDRMIGLINAFRSDLNDPDLPFYLVQLGCWTGDYNKESIDGWNTVREAQRQLVSKLPYLGLASAIDLDLDDGIHIGTVGLKRLGKRLADVADGYASPDFVSAVKEGNGDRLRVTFKNVRGGLTALGKPAGFSLRQADGTEWPKIYKVKLEGDAAILLLDGTLSDGLNLWYGWGLNPYCNITDAQDASVPAFGPAAIS